MRPNPAGPRPQRCSAPESSDDRDYFVDQRDLLTEEGSAEAVLAEINSRLSAAGVSGDFEAKQFAYKAKADSAVTNLVLVVGRTPCVDQMPEQKSYATERRNDVSSALHATVNHVEGIVGHALVL